jgi:NADPH-dependent glutamate synthase beta subunit-like oxidoreductase/glutamate synthase domain-containing protein 3/NAD-dependent dihydropyrimidine dehydrogenase PreA subunit
MAAKKKRIIEGKKDDFRIESRIMEESIQKAVAEGCRHLDIHAFGQHGIGGRLWRSDTQPIHVKVTGPTGQRLGSMGFPHTFIEVDGPVSDDVGWLNAGAEILIRGHAGNGAGNAMAQGKIFVAGNLGARAMTMTKHNPRFGPPELWVLGSVGDYFGEFMAGGIAVICGVDAQNPDNVLGYRPGVGMVGGRIFFRGPHQGYSRSDAKLVPLGNPDWQWLKKNLKNFLKKIARSDIEAQLLQRDAWQLLVARKPHEKVTRKRKSMQAFRREAWDAELGPGGLIGDLSRIDRSPIPLVPAGKLRRFIPLWENRKYAAPCETGCPTGIPLQERWRLVREGRIDEAVDLALAYTPFPATVCGYLCPNPCMDSCTRQSTLMAPVDTAQLGKASMDAKLPDLPPDTGHRIAVVGGGPGGISTAWQLRQMGHHVVVYDMADQLGGKISAAIPDSRIPREVVEAELGRIRDVISHVHLHQRLTSGEFDQIRADYDFVVIAVGAQKPRTLPIPGSDRMVAALDFLASAKSGEASVGEKVVIIGAGNVGCDAATEAHRLGAGQVTLLDVQEPASFGAEREAAEQIGAVFRWPCVTREITPDAVVLDSGEEIPADSIIISIGDAPDLEFLSGRIGTENGFIQVDDFGQTDDPKVFAIGDAVKPGLLTDAIGAGRKAASAIDDILHGRRPAWDLRQTIDKNRITLEYFDPRVIEYKDINQCGAQCASCGTCRDCGICVNICPQAAIRREERDGGDYAYVVDDALCIGCGFCAGACPCGVWSFVENEPLA